MTPIRYKAESAAEAFETAAKDIKHWDFPSMEALADMAVLLRNGYQPTRSGLGYDCFCSRGYFKLYNDDPKRGYGIVLVALTGRESGIDNPAAQEVLDFHRDRLDQPLFAVPLLDLSSHISSIDDLDLSYTMLLDAKLIELAEPEIEIEIDKTQVRRPTYIVRSSRIFE